MSGKKRILVVDDHFEMLEFFRSMLELSNSDYQVLAAPSAEEGLLELRRTARSPHLQSRDSSAEHPIDLLITDVRLPGMSGFDLVRKVRDVRPDLPVMMITAYASAQGKEEANSLGVYRYFEKPLDTDALLAAVHAVLTIDGTLDTTQTALDVLRTEGDGALAPARRNGSPSNGSMHQRPGQVADSGEKAVGATRRRATAADDVTARLEALLSDTGAVQTMLANKEGTILFRAGEAHGVAVERLARLLARSLSHSFELAAELASTEPFTIQYQAGERADLYTANIGRDYFLALLFDAQARRGRIGTVWVFAQRAIRAFQELLPFSEQAVAQTAAQVAEKANGTTAQDNVDDEVMDLFALMEQSDDLPEMDLDAFWEEATADAGGVAGDGLSFEEAVERGLLPQELQEGLK